MELEYEVPDITTLAENIRGLYKPREDGTGFILQVKGATSKAKLDEFRQQNITLQQQMDKFKDVDPEKYKALAEQARQLEEEELVKSGDIEKIVENRVKTLKAEKDREINSRDEQLRAANSQLEYLLIDNAVKTAGIQNGVIPTAMDDVVLRARAKFKIENGRPVSKDDKGEIVYGSDGTSPLSVTEWAKSLKTEAPHLFQGSNGGGAGGGNRPNAPSGGTKSAVDKIRSGLTQGIGA